MIGAFVAAAAVALFQYARSRDRRLLPLAAMLVLQAAALFDGWGDFWRDAFQLSVCLAGLGLVLVLSSSHPGPGRPLDGGGGRSSRS
jgi:peptidoglycan/LPS O-acetylase OafA/YrhL